MASFDIYEAVTKEILARLEQGVVPWRSPILGRSSAGHPKNLQSAKPYRGINVFLLACTAWSKGYGSSYWLTFNQAKERGAMVRKGERSSMVVFWKQYDTVDKDTKEKIKVPVLRYYNVFNVEQCEGVDAPDRVPFEPVPLTPVEAAERIVTGYAAPPVIEHGGCRAFYRPATDTVTLPEATRFATNEEYYSTCFHELAHSTGHSKRLNRKLDTEPHVFGSADYGKEELIAEMTAAFLCGHAGIEPQVIDNQAAYLDGWLTAIKGDKRLVVSAGGAAQRACDWILGLRSPSTVES